ncbi:hypothetical protein HDE76_003784 [Rhodanobacter sp. ANJX3]|uniref:hypothetical protein n=1 Tax=Rhodanobacter sp. ANJX3 TaxID=2723083 RepID=UPI0016155A30|nr:hypothetical protein [Rhodanobacter sp. ANJX3]MBB5360540.1 hypothetical protein [Rhodanobacter sp. ANJX3]
MNFNSLLEIETRLRDHFRSLALSKKHDGGSIPSFALEHPLTETERRALGQALSEQLGRDRGLTQRFWLSWVVHATEQGYEFAGLQYWPTFAKRTPNWERFGDSAMLRKLFERFASEFLGVRPRGVWATHYSYISWPVTNAIVPKDLQVRLAESIYHARNQLRHFIGRSHESLGELIREHSYYCSTRYKHFLEQTALVGQVVHALIQQDNGPTLIQANALKRIVEDISTRAQAREWLSDARSSYQRAKIRLVSHDKSSLDDATTDDPPDRRARSSIPRLQSFQIIVRRTVDGFHKVWLAPPSFQGLCDEHPSLRAILDKSCITIGCHGERSSPARSLLSPAPREWTLSRWPTDGEALIAFEPQLPILESILTGSCKFPSATIWLFVVHADGSATLCRDPVVHSDDTFLIASRDHRMIAAIGTPIDVQCDGVAMVKVTMPTTASSEMIIQLKALGIGVRRRIDIAPAGLYPRRWSQTGESEWLTSESVTLAVKREHEFSLLGLGLDGGSEQQLKLTDAETALISLGHLTAGSHTLCVNAYSGEVGLLMRREAHTSLHLLVRTPSPWVPSRISTEELIVTASPEDPSIDDLLSGRLTVSADGLPATQIRCRLILTDDRGDRGVESELFTTTIPFTEAFWSQHLDTFLSDHAIDREFVSMTEGCLEFESALFGVHRMALAARVQPLRWMLDRDRNGGTLTLTNEGVGEETIALEHYPFASPLVGQPVDLRSALSGINLAEQRGLFVARSSTAYQAVVISPSQPGGDFSTLADPIDRHCWDGQNDLVTVVERYKLWSQARASNALARLRQYHVLGAILRHAHSLVCGDSWVAAEEELPNAPSDKDWDQLERAVEPNGPLSYAISLGKAWSTQQQSHESLEQMHHRISLAYKLVPKHSATTTIAWQVADDVTELSPEFALTLASTEPKAFATLVRGARLLHLFADRRRGKDDD